MSFFTEIAILFQGMSWIVWLTLVLGYVFILIELFQPGFGVFGTVGAAIIALGIVLRVSEGDGNIFAQIFIIVFMVSVATLIAFIALALTAKKGWVMRSPLAESATQEVSTQEIDVNSFKGKYGVALTDLTPIGTANLEGEVVDVASEGFYIDKGENVFVTRIEDGKIKVDRAEN
ncbi:MAG: hypothetical protein J6V69_01665 [Clostridia bacterium]|nr:hypothetical protein [Clostridia bacterium]